MRRLLVGVLVCASLAGRGGVAWAQIPPDESWRQLEHGNFRVTYVAGLDELARHAALRAEVAYARLAATLTRPPDGTIDIVLTDNIDFSNGFAMPFPSNRIVLYAKPPVDSDALNFYEDWIDLLVTHELTHIFHLDRAGRVGQAIRRVFGRVPLAWPAFPALGTPRWSIEGLATHIESDFTGAGRVHGTYHDMIVRTAVLEDRFDPLDRANSGSPIWPGEARVYIYGSLFFDYLAERFGEDVRGRIVDRTASAAIPPLLWFGGVGRRTIGMSWGRAYSEWHDHLRTEYGRLADSLRAVGLTESERITTHGRIALHPRLSPDGRRLAYAAQDGRNVTQTRVLDVETMAMVQTTRRNGTGPVSWRSDDALATSQFEFDDPYHIFQDLYAIEAGREVRLTHGARLQDPDVDARRGRWVAVENADGTNRLVIFDPGDRSVRPVVEFRQGVHWAWPRWSPEGDRIAASVWTQGGAYDVVVIDTLGNVLTWLTRDRGVDATPAWSPDGRYLLFGSDRTGIPNLYAADLAGPTPLIRQVTSVLTGAQHPDVSADGRWIYFSRYHSDGWHIARMPFDPRTWRELSPLRPLAQEDGEAGSVTTAAPTDIAEQAIESRRYSAWRSVLPTFWIPLIYGGVEEGTFYGAASAGFDLVGRHAWNGYLTVDPSASRWEGSVAYSFGGLGNPVIDVAVSRDWETTIGVLFRDTAGDVRRDAIASEDGAALFARLVHRGWRSSGTLALGVEGVLVRREILDPPVPGAVHPDPRDELFGVLARMGYANFRSPPYAISREDGITISLAARTRRERDPHEANPQGYSELTGWTAGYKSLRLPAFAHHVAAVRASGLLRTGDGATPSRIGGVPGGVLNTLGFELGEGGILLPVRGFERGKRRGTTAWTASAEYRLPLALVGRRPSLSPLYIDRISASAFADAGDAWCTGNAATRFQACLPESGGATGPRSPLVGIGAELVVDAALGALGGGRFRFGAAIPVSDGTDRAPRAYVQFGSAF